MLGATTRLPGIRIGAGGVADVKGSGGTIEAQQRLRALFGVMLSNNVATSEHLAEVVRACANSEEMRDTIQTYMKADDSMNAVTVRRLRYLRGTRLSWNS